MDHTDFHKIFQTLLPIAIFVFWALISRPAKKRKKEQEAIERTRRAQQQEEPHSQPSAPSPAQQGGGHGTQTWKRAFDDILGEMGVPVEREEPAPTPVETPHHEKAQAPSESGSLEDLEPETGRIPEPKRAVQATPTAPVPESAYTQHDSPITSKTAYAIEPSLAAQSSMEDQRLHDLGGYSPAELQRLIVWSEVLGKPLALRDGH